MTRAGYQTSDEMPVAGPSSGLNALERRQQGRRAVRRVHSALQDVPDTTTPGVCSLGDACPFYRARPGGVLLKQDRRQAPSTSFASTASLSSSQSTATGASTTSSSSSTGLFVGPSTSSSSAAATSSASLPLFSQTVSSSTVPLAGTLPASASTSVGSPGRTSRTSLYSVTRTAAVPAATPTYTPGVLLDLTLNGDTDTQAVYGVPMSFGHGGGPNSKRSLREDGSRDKGKRRPSTQWDGNALQNVTLQVDLGSSDMWVATEQCTTFDCNSAPMLFNSSGSIDSGEAASLSYQRGGVSGDIMWEEVQLGAFGIGYQAFIGATSVTNEGLGGGQFSGLLGLALPANSVILGLIPGTTSNDPDGATFLDNLFGSGAIAPSQRFFSLSLARREDVRTRSVLGIGTTANDLCPAPCNSTGLPIIARPSLGVTGFLHWRVALGGLSALKFDNAQAGTGMTSTPISLGASVAVTGRPQPVVVLDSGGVEILAGYKPHVDAIYAAFGVTASPDGLYRMPCTQPISLSFTFAGKEYPIHPLDMSWPDPDDPARKTCIGAIQYTSSLGETGDFILGSSFLKNVYSVFNYPDYNRSSWQPTVGLSSLTNASIASQDFYAVRTLRQSLASVSSNSGPSVPGVSGSSPSAATAGGGSDGKAVVSTGIIIGASVGGVFVLAVLALLAWWFWGRRKYGANGVMKYRDPPVRPKSGSRKSDVSTSSLNSRSRKHDMALRQKSMIEGYSDYEGDSWLSGTEGADSIRLGYLPEVAEDPEDRGRPRDSDDRQSFASSSRTRSLGPRLSRPITNTAVGVDLVDLPDVTPAVAASPGDVSRTQSRNLSQSPSRRSRLVPISPDEDVPAPAPYAYPAYAPFPASAFPPSTKSKRNVSMSMSGPFPSPMRASLMMGGGSGSGGGGTGELVSSPLQDIRNSDYFGIVPADTGSPSKSAREQ